ncbi:S-adenosyl-L-methionine-dependent methyltransferase [Pelagophyceae sp. CCMP2097]|nr:S-adenosyl-L-methionine-dependent methyltransferase [Pelagophyceae sp. CCMP2097]
MRAGLLRAAALLLSLRLPGHAGLEAPSVRRRLERCAADGVGRGSPVAVCVRRRRALAGAAAGFAFTPVARAGDYSASSYDGYASSYDSLDGGGVAKALGLDAARQALLKRATGRVLEVGAGTGLSLPFYDARKVQRLDLLDASPGMLAEARVKVDGGACAVGDVRLFQSDAAQTPFAAETFDTAVDTFALCVYDDAVAVLRELRRILKPTGELLLLENSRPTNPVAGAYVDFTADMVARNGGKGCKYNQDVLKLVQDAGFQVKEATPLFGGFFVQIVLSPV